MLIRTQVLIYALSPFNRKSLTSLQPLACQHMVHGITSSELSFMPYKGLCILLQLQVFDIASGEQLALLNQGHYDTVTACAYSPNTQQLFSAATDGVVLVWEPWTQPDTAADAAASDAAGQVDRDWWLAAASGRRQQQQQQPSGPATVGARAANRPTAADIDAWSEDEGMV
jgi:hypothetical protein